MLILKEQSKVLAIDPGETTGYVIANVEDKKTFQILEQGEKIHFDKSRDKEPRLLELYNWLKEVDPDILIIENFKLYAHKASAQIGSEFIPVQLIAIAKFWAEKNKKPYHLQMASQAKGFVNDEKLKFKNLYYKGYKHSRDAMRHLIYFLQFGYNKAT